jgi:nucleoside-diphosphate-sugar epimerase
MLPKASSWQRSAMIDQIRSTWDLAARIAAIAGFSGRIAWDGTKPNGQPRRCLDVTRAEREFGFRAATPFDGGLRKTIQWFQSNRAEIGKKAYLVAP